LKKGLINVVIAGFAIALGISLSMKPWRVFEAQRHSTDLQIEQMHKVEAEHIQDLQAEAKYGSKEGREELARAQGWRRQGEVPADE
jgi:hypothetical protein